MYQCPGGKEDWKREFLLYHVKVKPQTEEVGSKILGSKESKQISI